MGLFFDREGVMTEQACEPYDTCNTDNEAFKGVAAQWLGATLRIVPNSTAGPLPGNLRSSAKAAIKQCSGGKNGTECGLVWISPKADRKHGLGQELSAMNILVANLAAKSTKRPNNASSPGQSALTTGSRGSAPNLTSTPSPSAQPAGSGSAGLKPLVAGNVALYALLAATFCFWTL